MKHVHLFSFLLLSLLYACSDRQVKTSVVTTFGETGSLVAQVQKIPEPILLPRYMGIANDQLFVYKEKEDRLFEFFSLPDCSFLGSVGSRGQGPDEFGLLDTRSFDNSENNFKVLEAGSNILKTVVFKDNHLAVTHAESIFEQGVPNVGLYPLRDSVYLTFGNITDANEYCLLNRESGDLTKIGEYPYWVKANESKDGMPIFFNYIKNCVVHPQGNKFAIFYGYIKRLRIFDNHVNLLSDIDVQIEPCSTNFETGPNTKDFPVYYIGQPQATENYIYALCSNAKGSGPDIPSDCELHVFDWKGNPVACYKFDRRVSLIALSEKYNKIFALNNRIDDELYIYDIPKHK